MEYKNELLKIWNECINEIFQDEKLDDDNRLDLDLVREGLLAQLNSQVLSKKDEDFVYQNLHLYKRLFKGLLNYNEKEIKLVLLEMLRAKNNM